MVEALIDESIEVNNDNVYKSEAIDTDEKLSEKNRDNDDKDSSDGGENMINNLLKTFGGKIVK